MLFKEDYIFYYYRMNTGLKFLVQQNRVIYDIQISLVKKKYGSYR